MYWGEFYSPDGPNQERALQEATKVIQALTVTPDPEEPPGEYKVTSRVDDYILAVRRLCRMLTEPPLTAKERFEISPWITTDGASVKWEDADIAWTGDEVEGAVDLRHLLQCTLIRTSYNEYLVTTVHVPGEIRKAALRERRERTAAQQEESSPRREQSREREQAERSRIEALRVQRGLCPRCGQPMSMVDRLRGTGRHKDCVER